jgi:hypothetical protein
MKICQTYESFVKKLEEEALQASEGSDVYIDDYTLDSGEVINSAEILGAIHASETEKEFKQYFYQQYGQGSFATGELDELTKFFNQVKAEDQEQEGDGDDSDLDVEI